MFGWSLGESREGAVLGAYVAQHYQGEKVAVVYAPDQAGDEGLAGFSGAARGVRVLKMVVTSEASTGSAVSAARSAGARVVISFTSAAMTARLASDMGAVKWHVPLVAAGSGLAAGLPDGVVTDGFLPSPGAAASSAAGSWIALFRRIRAKYLAAAPFSPALISGMASAYELASALFRSGPTLTRPGLLSALSGMQPGPAAVPLAYTLADHGGPEGGYIGTVRGGILMPSTGALVAASALAGAPVSGYASPVQPALADGIPPH